MFLETPALSSLELNFARILKKRHPTLKILSSGFSEDLELLQLAIEHQIDGFAMNRPEPHELVYTVKQIASGQPYLCCQLAVKCLSKLTAMKTNLTIQVARSSLKISERELEILKLVADGLSNTEITEKLFSSKRTIEGNRAKLLEKTGTKNTAKLLVISIRNCFID